MLSQIGYILGRLQKKSKFNAILESSIDGTAKIESGSQIVNVKMGKHSFCGYDCVILNCDIGSYCSIADSVYIGGSQHPMHFVSTSPVFLSHRDSVKEKFARFEYSMMPRTTVGHDVWIGHGAKVKAGVTVGHGAVIGMGSVVTKDVSPYAIVAGNPAAELRKRFSPNIISGLLRSKWWEASDDDLREMARFFDDPEKFLSRY